LRNASDAKKSVEIPKVKSGDAVKIRDSEYM
jgi:hypothetical protein